MQAEHHDPEQYLRGLVCTDQTLPLTVFSVPHSSPQEFHSHDFVELVYVSHGAGLHLVAAPDAGDGRGRSQSYSIMAGDIFAVSLGEQHAYADTEGLRIVNVIFAPELLKNDLAGLREVPGIFDLFVVEPWFRDETSFRYKLHLSAGERRIVEGLLSRLGAETEQKGPGYRTIARALLLELLITVGRAYAQVHAGETDRIDLQGKRDAIQQAVLYIEKNFAESLSLKAISEQAFLSPHYFSEQFKQKTGLSPWEYLTRVRLDQAKQLLSETDRKVTDIAFSVGFGDPSHFAKVFRSREGQSPNAFRLNSRKTTGLS